MTVTAFYGLSIEGASFDTHVRRVVVHEQLHAGHTIVVNGGAIEGGQRTRVDAEALIGAKATLSAQAPGGPRVISGVVERVEQHGTEVTFELRPPIQALANTLDHRVFVDEDALAIAKTVLEEHGLEVDARVQRTDAPRAQCVQAFESDLAFVSRLLAEEGVCWHVDPADPAAQVVWADHAGGYQPIEGDPILRYDTGEASGLRSAGESVFEARLRVGLASDQVTYRDWDFEHPDNDLTASASDGDGARERYEYPGAGRYTDKGAGDALAAVRLDQLRCTRRALEGRSTCMRLSVGRTFTLDGAPRADMNGDWTIIELHSEGLDRAGDSEERRFTASFVAVPAETTYRPIAPAAPSMGGVQTATITGPSGSEIHTDEYGRVTALLRHDRRGKADETSSTFLRPMHPATSGGFMLPRVGWEALVGFQGPSGDRPHVLGRLDNGSAPAAEKLPAHKVRSNFGTPTTPGGGKGHLLRIDDSAGSSDMTIDASKNYNEKTTSNKHTSIKGTDTRTVKTQDLIYDSNRSRKVDSAQSIDVGADRKVTSGGGMVIDAGSELVAVGGTREIKVLGDYACNIGADLMRAVGGAKIVTAIAGNNRHVNATSTIAVGGAWRESGAISGITVNGVSSLTSSTTTITCSSYMLNTSFLNETCASRTENAGTEWLLDASSISMTCAATTLKGSQVVISGKSSVTINAGGGSIKVTPGQVVISGEFTADGDLMSSAKTEHE